MLITIVVPVFNEEKTIGTVIRNLLELSLPAEVEREIVIVDDASTDETFSIISANHASTSP